MADNNTESNLLIRKSFIEQIKEKDPTFEVDKFLNKIEEYEKYMSLTYAYYPPYDTDQLIEDAVHPNVEEIESLIDPSTILHQYLKVNKYLMNGDIYNSKNPSGVITIRKRRECRYYLCTLHTRYYLAILTLTNDGQTLPLEPQRPTISQHDKVSQTTHSNYITAQ